MAGLGINYDVEDQRCSNVRFDDASRLANTGSLMAHRTGRSSTEPSPQRGHVIDLPAGDEKVHRRPHGHRRMSTQAIVQLASQTVLTPRRLAILFCVCFSATYLAALVPLPHNLFAAQHVPAGLSRWEAKFGHHDESRPTAFEAARSGRRRPKGQRKGGQALDAKKDQQRQETAFQAAGGGGAAAAHAWAMLGDELALGGKLVKEHMPAKLTMGDVMIGKALRWLGLVKPSVALSTPAPKPRDGDSRLGKDLPHPSWAPPTHQAPAITTGEDDVDELLIVSARGGRHTVIRRLPLPFQKTEHGPSARFVEHRDAQPGTLAAKKSAVAFGTSQPVEDERSEETGRAMEEEDVHAIAAKAAASLVKQDGPSTVMRPARLSTPAEADEDDAPSEDEAESDEGLFEDD